MNALEKALKACPFCSKPFLLNITQTHFRCANILCDEFRLWEKLRHSNRPSQDGLKEKVQQLKPDGNVPFHELGRLGFNRAIEMVVDLIDSLPTAPVGREECEWTRDMEWFHVGCKPEKGKILIKGMQTHCQFCEQKIKIISSPPVESGGKEGVHRTHCCVDHGCKYRDEDCPVVNGRIKQDYLCEDCDSTPPNGVVQERIMGAKILFNKAFELNSKAFTNNTFVQLKRMVEEIEQELSTPTNEDK